MYQKMTTLRKLSLITGVALLLIGLLPNYLGGISAVFAEGEVTPTAEPAADEAVDEPAEESANSEDEELSLPEATQEPETADAAELAAETQVAQNPASEPPVVEEPTLDEEVVVEVVAEAAEKDVVLADASGEPLNLASQETADLLSEIADPWFEDSGVIYGYSATGACVAGVHVCYSNLANPIQEAIDDAPSGATIYIKPDASYLSDEIDVNKNVTLMGVAGSNTTDLTPDDVTIGTINLWLDISGWLNVFGNVVNVESESAKIQDAVDIVKSGGQVNVTKGTYEETLTIDKPLTLSGDVGSPTVFGPGSEAPTLSQGGSWQTGTGITLNAGNITIQGFILEGFEDFIDVNGQSGANFNNNMFLYKPSSGDYILGTPDVDDFNIKFPSEVNGQFYNNECDASSDCTKVDGVGSGDDVNQEGVGETYDIDANVVVIKAATEEFFFTPDTQDCDPDTAFFCVTFNGDGTITIVRYNAPHDISHIQFWNFDYPECEGEGCLEILDLNLTSMCWEDNDTHRFRVHNPNSFPVDFTWEVYGTAQNGGGTALPGYTYFTITGVYGNANTTKLYWNDENGAQQQKTKAVNQNFCEPILDLNLTSMCWEDETTHQFRVYNPNSFAVDFTYEVYGTAQTGGGTANPGYTFFTITGTYGAANTTKIYWTDHTGTEKQKTKAVNQNFCEPISGCLDPLAANYNPAATVDSEYCEYDLVLDPFCVEVEGTYQVSWSIFNPNNFSVDVSWSLDGNNGAASIPSGNYFIGYTDDGPATHILNASWEFGEGSLSFSEVCAPTITTDDPGDPDTPLVAAGGPIIPVTGADLAGQSLLSFGGVLLIGLSLLFKGIANKMSK